MYTFSTTVTEISKKIIPLEKRELAKNARFIKRQSLWPKVLQQPGVMHSSTKEVIELAFSVGGYIAGGFARWANADEISVISRSSYISLGGDIDLFFRTEEGFKNFLTELCKLDKANSVIIKQISLSVGKLAVNILFTPKLGQVQNSLNKMPTIQAIGCVVGEPEEVMQSFDFINCMIAFDDKNTWLNEDQELFERKKQLGISCWASRSLPYRIQKYCSKYGFMSCVDCSNNRKQQLYSVNKDSHKAAQRICNAWVSFFQGNFHPPFENDEIFYEIYSLFILPFLNIKIDNLRKYLTYVNNSYAVNHVGSYYSSLEVMKKNKFFERSGVTQDPNSLIEISADEYCWSF